MLRSRFRTLLVLSLLATSIPAAGSTPQQSALGEASARTVRTRVPFVAAPESWNRFLILVWQYKTRAARDLQLYREAGFDGFHIDYGAGQESTVRFAAANHLPYYVDHAAGKGYLYLSKRTGVQTLPKDGRLTERPQSLADPATFDRMVEQLKANLTVIRHGPVVAIAFDDEISLGTFTSPIEVDNSPRSVAMYREWLRSEYQSIQRLNASWNPTAPYRSFSAVRPVPFGEVRLRNARPPFARWNLASWMDWRTFMDWQFATLLGRLTRVANRLAPGVPAGFVGGQQPAPYGGYDYDQLRDSVQWTEAYDIGGTNEILRSFWCYPERKPHTQTFFSTGNARRDSWFLWYYLLHGNRAVIAWPARGNESWFASGQLAPFIADNRSTFREVQGTVSRHLLADDVRFDADPIAVLYSHASIQASWATDVVTHGKTWPRRSSGLDNTCQTAGKNRVAWFKLLEDCGYQYNVVSAREVAQGELKKRAYRVLILGRAIALSDPQCRAIEAFVREGGTVIADYWPALLDQHGKGRASGGLDRLFGITRDESKGYFNGNTITEIDGERYRQPFLQRLPAGDILRDQEKMIVERGTRASSARARTTVHGADVVMRRRVQRGTAVYLNLSPVEYYDNTVRLDQRGRQWRKLLSQLLHESGLAPRASVRSGGQRVPMTEVLFWKTPDVTLLGIVKNPSRQAAVDGAGTIAQQTAAPMEVAIQLDHAFGRIRDLRTGKRLPPGRQIQAHWNPWEGLLFELSEAD